MNLLRIAVAAGLLSAMTAGAALAQLPAEDPLANVRVEAVPVSMFNQHLYLGTMSSPRGIAYDAAHQEIWVADTGNGAVSVYRPDGVELYAFSAGLRDPVRIAMAPGGRVAVLEASRNRIRIFNYRGDPQQDLALPELDEKPVIGALAYAPDGTLYVGENRSGQVFVFGPDGQRKIEFGTRGTGEGQFQSICGIAVGKDGRIYVADQIALAVQVFDHQGNFIRGWGKHEIGGEHFSLPSGIAVDARGFVLVSDELRHQVKVFTTEGRFLTNVGGLGDGVGQFSFPTDIALDERGRIYVTERATSRVQVLQLQFTTPGE